jgi:hypothetical protein
LDERNEALMGLQRQKVMSYTQNAQLEREVEALKKQLEKMEQLEKTFDSSNFNRNIHNDSMKLTNNSYAHSNPGQKKSNNFQQQPRWPASSIYPIDEEQTGVFNDTSLPFDRSSNTVITDTIKSNSSSQPLATEGSNRSLPVFNSSSSDEEFVKVAASSVRTSGLSFHPPSQSKPKLTPKGLIPDSSPSQHKSYTYSHHPQDPQQQRTHSNNVDIIRNNPAVVQPPNRQRRRMSNKGPKGVSSGIGNPYYYGSEVDSDDSNNSINSINSNGNYSKGERNSKFTHQADTNLSLDGANIFPLRSNIKAEGNFDEHKSNGSGEIVAFNVHKPFESSHPPSGVNKSLRNRRRTSTDTLNNLAEKVQPLVDHSSPPIDTIKNDNGSIMALNNVSADSAEQPSEYKFRNRSSHSTNRRFDLFYD